MIRLVDNLTALAQSRAGAIVYDFFAKEIQGRTKDGT
jgi:hypothetical protein